VDQILCDEDVSAGTRHWPLSDHLGSVRDVIDDSGTVELHRIYDAFGNQGTPNPATYDHLFAYTGRPLDEDTGLQNNLHRWYDAPVGRWLSEDPAGVGANLYEYVGNRPLMFADPLGLWRQYKRDAPHLWQAQKGDRFRQLVEKVAQKYGLNIDPEDVPKYRGAIRPWPVVIHLTHFGILDGKRVDLADLKGIAALWNRKLPRECALYDISGIVRHANNSLPEGRFLKLTIGNPAFETGVAVGFLNRATTFFSATRVNSGRALVEELGRASNYGWTPVRNVWVIGHSGVRSRAIGGSTAEAYVNEDYKFEMKDLGDIWWQSYEDAVTPDGQYTTTFGRFPVGFWFRGDAKVRFIGCKTADFAAMFEEKALRDNAEAIGTTRNTRFVDEHTATWGPERNDTGDFSLPTARTADEYFSHPYWTNTQKQ